MQARSALRGRIYRADRRNFLFCRHVFRRYPEDGARKAALQQEKRQRIRARFAEARFERPRPWDPFYGSSWHRAHHKERMAQKLLEHGQRWAASFMQHAIEGFDKTLRFAAKDRSKIKAARRQSRGR